MSSGNPIDVIEKLNAEYIRHTNNETPEIRLAKKLIKFKKIFPFHMIKWMKNHRDWKIQKKRLESITTFVPEEKLMYAGGKVEKNKKGVVYGCITNGYDAPFEPWLVSDSMDYILYTDSMPETAKDSVWEHRKIDLMGKEKQSTLTNRYYKFHPFEFFEGYDYSVYVDGNVQIISDISALYHVAKNAETGIAMHRHAHRDCGYMDAQWCEICNRGNLKNMKQQVEDYHKEGFPNHYGLCEATIIVVDLKNETAKKIMNEWWEEYIRAGSGRDQLAFMYVLWKNGYGIDDVGNLGNDEYRNPKFRINAHKGVLY